MNTAITKHCTPRYEDEGRLLSFQKSCTEALLWLAVLTRGFTFPLSVAGGRALDFLSPASRGNSALTQAALLFLSNNRWWAWEIANFKAHPLSSQSTLTMSQLISAFSLELDLIWFEKISPLYTHILPRNVVLPERERKTWACSGIVGWNVTHQCLHLLKDTDSTR